MRNYMFKNRWGALLFVCLTVYGAVSLIGTKDDDGLLLRATEDLTHTKDDFRHEASKLDPVGERPATQSTFAEETTSWDDSPDDFASDDDLIESAKGFDPTPDVQPDQEVGNLASPDEVAIIVEGDDISQ